MILGRRFFEALATPNRWPLDTQSPFEKKRVLDPEPWKRTLDKGWRNLVRTFPEFAEVQVEHRWAGYIDVTPDLLPVISDVDALPGLVIATGFSGHGFGPGAGRLAAELATSAPTVVDPAQYRLDRLIG